MLVPGEASSIVESDEEEIDDYFDDLSDRPLFHQHYFHYGHYVQRSCYMILKYT